MAKTKNKKAKKVIILVGILLLVAVPGWFAFFRKPSAIITVQSEKASRRDMTELVVATGKIQPVVFVKISPEVSGEITELPVKEGQDVKKGDLLFKIKPDTYLALRNISEANYKGAQAQNLLSKANLEKAMAEYKRGEELYQNKLISDSQFLDYKTSADIAKASYESSTHQMDNAKAALARAEEDLSKTVVSSPLTGTISKLNSQLGERVVGTATYQGTEVMTIADLNDMEARVDIGEIDIVLISIGQKARLEVDAFRDRKFTGKVTEIANTAKSTGVGSQQEATKFEVRIRVQEKEAFRPGMSVSSEIETRYRTNVLAIPTQCVTTRLPKDAEGGSQGKAAEKATEKTNVAPAGKKESEKKKPLEVVFTVDGDKTKMVTVKRGISDESHTEILEGIKEGQEVITGTYKAINRDLEDGKQIKVDNKKTGLEKKVDK
jgi:HlyD family secretion protein